MEYTKEYEKIFGLNCKVPSVLIHTWDMDASADRILYIISVVPIKEIQNEAIRCGFPLESKEITFIHDSQKMVVPVLEAPLWVVPQKVGYNFLLVEETDPNDQVEEGDIGELIIVEMMGTYQRAKERRDILLSG